jgi:hypothetical protein
VNKLSRYAFAAVLITWVSAALAFGQHEPVVRVRLDSCDGGQCSVGLGNGVIIASDGREIAVLTAGHVVRRRGVARVMIRGNWITAKWIGRSDRTDIAYIIVPFAGQVPIATIAQQIQPGATVELRTHWPGDQWQFRRFRGRLGQRLTNTYGGHETLITISSIQGVSGSPVYTGNQLAGILVAGTDTGESTIVVASDIRAWLAQHKIGLAGATPPTPAQQQPQPVARCNCEQRFAAIEQRLAELFSRLDGVSPSRGTDAAQELAALQGQITILRSELEALQPLLERQVILVSDGRITSQKTLKPSDPIVLGSEIVVRKNAGN